MVFALVAVAVPGTAAADSSEISSSEGLVCALDGEQDAVCWGSAAFYRVVDGIRGEPQVPPSAIAGFGPAAEISVASANVCLLEAAGRVYCWGRNEEGQLGNGGRTGSPVPPARFGSFDDAIDVASGSSVTCAVRANSTVWCAGSAATSGSSAERLTPTAVPGLTGAVEVVHGGGRVCARLADGGLRCWGSNTYGALGTGAGTASIPRPVVGIDDAVDVTAGGNHGCAVLRTGRVRCWGRNHLGQLGDGTTTDRPTPVDVIGIDDAVEVSAAAYTTCVRRVGGRVSCWGDGELGLLGDPLFANSSTPVEIAGLSDVRLIAVGDAASRTSGYGNASVCVVRTTGRAACWGSNSSGELGNGAAHVLASPRAMEGVTAATDAALGAYHACALLRGGTVSCSGGVTGSGVRSRDADSGVLGNGAARPYAPVPIPVPGVTGVSAIAASGRNTCVITGVPGRVVCWGANNRTQLGTADAAARGPREVSGIASASTVAVGGNEATSFGSSEGRSWACAVDAGAVECWGHGFLTGSTSMATSATPVPALDVTGAPILDATAVAASSYSASISQAGAHTCVIRSDRSVWCWGQRAIYGGAAALAAEIGLARQVLSLGSGGTPVVTGRATQIATGASHSCAILEGGYVECWGWNIRGALGIGSTSPSQSSTPRRVASLGPDPGQLGAATAIASSSFETCVVANARVYCWGNRPVSSEDRLSPTEVAGSIGAVAVTMSPRTNDTQFANVCWVTSAGRVLCDGLDPDSAFGSRNGWSDLVLDVDGYSGPLPPRPPMALVLTPGDTVIAASWEAPSSGPSPNGYTVTAQPGGATCAWTGGPLTCTLTGLENGTAYTVKVRAVNAIGAGDESAGVRATPFGVPGTPRQPVLDLAYWDKSVRASWRAPDDGGRPLNRLEVDVEPGAYGCTVGGGGAVFATNWCSTGVPFSAYGVEYRVRMRAANEAGWGAWSEWSAGFTPRIAPSAPVQISARAGDQRALIAWTASEPRGAPVERYAVCLTGSHVDDPGPPPRADPGSRSCGPGTFAKPLVCDVPAEPDEVPGKTVHACTVTGLRNGQTVRAVVYALNAVGWSGSDGGRRWFSPSTRVEPSTTASGFARVRIRCSPTSGIPVCIVRVRLEVDFKPYVFRSPRIRLEPRTWTTVDVGMPEDVRERLGSEGFARARVVVESSALEVVEAPQVLELAAPPAEGVGEVKMEPVSSTDKVAVGVPCNGTRYDRCTGYMELKEFAQVRARAGGGVLARVRFSVRGGEVARVELRLNARARALLRRRGELTVRPVLTMVGGTKAPRLAPVRLVAADPTGVAARVEAVAAALDRTELLAVVRAAAAQELAWSDAARRLERDVLPGYRRAVARARAVPKGAPRLREARGLLIAAARRQVAAAEAYATWLRDDDLAANRRALVDDRTARAWLDEALRIVRAEAEAP